MRNFVCKLNIWSSNFILPAAKSNEWLSAKSPLLSTYPDSQIFLPSGSMSATLNQISGWAPSDPEGRLCPSSVFVTVYLNARSLPTEGLLVKNGPSIRLPFSMTCLRISFFSLSASTLARIISQASSRSPGSAQAAGKFTPIETFNATISAVNSFAAAGMDFRNSDTATPKSLISSSESCPAFNFAIFPNAAFVF